jgi:hypothetical protein
MAADIPRTARDDAADALAALDEVEREIVRWRAHLVRVRDEPSLPAALQARRPADIVAALVREAHHCTRLAAWDAEVPGDALPV